MIATRQIFLIGSLVLLFALAGVCQSFAQGPVRGTVRDIHQTKMDYRKEKPFQYQPSDPWQRSKSFRRHTGHWGLFYNCDGEECKRESPYICWKVHHEPDLPAKKGFFRCLKDDLDEVKQRVRNGACCPDDVVQVASPCDTGSCGGCAVCSNPAPATRVESAIANIPSREPVERVLLKQPIRKNARVADNDSSHRIDPATGQCGCATCQKRLAKEIKLLR